MPISDANFRKFTKLVTEAAGIKIAENRKHMLVNRISLRLKHLGLRTHEEYYEHLRKDSSGQELQSLIDVVTTHYTSFFRDEGQFHHLKQHLSVLLASGQKKIRIWSAACSSGEELYSLAITAAEAASAANISPKDIRILGTDIAANMLERAQQAWFPISSLKSLTVLQRSFFEPNVKVCPETQQNMLRVNKELRDMVILRRVNLCDKPLAVPHGIDVVFCRNVLLYFDQKMQTQILTSILGKIKTDGLLYVGASESVRGLMTNVDPIRASVFKKTADAIVNDTERQLQMTYQ